MESVLRFVVCFFVFLFGSSIGSFLNVLIWRVPRHMPFISARSVCPECGERIREYDLIPILSYFLLGGRCRSCKAKIPTRYPLIEALTGALFVLIYLWFGVSVKTPVVMAATAILIAIAVIDFDTMEIPDGFHIAMAVIAVLSIFAFPETGIISRVIGFFAVSSLMLLIALTVENAFGGGDIKLMAVCGFLLGWQSVLLAMFFALLTGGGYGFYLLSKKADRKQAIAFGPHLCFGVFAALMWGKDIIDIYLRLTFGA